MSLTKCPECKRRISDEAISCPNCGFEIKKHLVATKQSGSYIEANPERFETRKRRRGSLDFALPLICLVVGFALYPLLIGTKDYREPKANSSENRKPESSVLAIRESKADIFTREFVESIYGSREGRRGAGLLGSKTLLEVIEHAPHTIYDDEARNVSITIGALRELGDKVSRYAETVGKAFTIERERYQKLLDYSPPEENLPYDAWGNRFAIRFHPFKEIVSTMGFPNESFSCCTIVSAGPDGKFYEGADLFITGYYCYATQDIIWCIGPEFPDCSTGKPSFSEWDVL